MLRDPRPTSTDRLASTNRRIAACFVLVGGLVGLGYSIHPTPRENLLDQFSQIPYSDDASPTYTRTVHLGDPTLTVSPRGLPAHPAAPKEKGGT